MSDAVVRLGLVGCGRIGRAYAEAAAACPDVALAAACDRDLAAADSIAGGAVGAYGAHRDMPGLDAVLVCTPPSSHAAIALHFVERGVPVLCEKPFTHGLGEALEVVRAARRRGKCVAMASKFRYVADVVETKRLLDSGAIGAPVLFENAFASFVDMAGRWNADARVSGGGVLIDNGSHALDLARWFLGPLAEIHVIEGPCTQGLGVEETVRISARSCTGVLCGIDLSWSLDRGSETYLRISGSEGVAVVGWRGARWRRRGGEWTAFGTGYDKIAALRQQLTHFARAVRGQRANLVTPLEALASVSAVDAAYASLRSGRWTPVRDFEEGGVAGEAGAA